MKRKWKIDRRPPCEGRVNYIYTQGRNIAQVFGHDGVHLHQMAAVPCMMSALRMIVYLADTNEQTEIAKIARKALAQTHENTY